MSIRKRLIILFTSVIVLVALLSFIFLYNGRSNEKTVSEQTKDRYTFIKNPSCSSVNLDYCRSGDFVYFYDYPSFYIGEYDIKNDKTVQINTKMTENLAYYNVYNGDFYAVRYDTIGINGIHLSIGKFNLNNGDYEPVYMPEPDVEGLFNFLMTTDGKMFFLERKPKSAFKKARFLTDDEGFEINNNLVMYDPETKEKTMFAEGAFFYCIYGDRIYYDKQHAKEHNVKLCYVDMDKPMVEHDTGVKLRPNREERYDKSNYFKIGDKLYFTGEEQNTAMTYSFKDGKVEKFYTSDLEDAKIQRTCKFRDKYLIIVGCTTNGQINTRRLIEYDPKTKKTKELFVDSQEDEDIVLFDMMTYDDSDDFYFFGTRPLTTWANKHQDEHVGYCYYLVYPDGTKKLMYDNEGEARNGERFMN